MKTFSLVATSEGPRREFKITWGLGAGYGPSLRIYDLEEAIRAADRWMRERDDRAAMGIEPPRKLPFLASFTILLIDIIGYIMSQMPTTCRQRQ